MKDNDDRVSTYGKNRVIRANRIQMVTKAYLGGVAAKATAEIGAYACRRALQKSGGVANAKTRATGAAALAALGLVVGVTAYDINRNIKDNSYAREYDARHSK